MGCSGCVDRVKKALLSLEDISDARVQLQHPQAVITMIRPVPPELMQMTLHKVGHYTIRKQIN